MSCGVDNLPDVRIGSPLIINIDAPFQRSVFYNDFSQLLENYRNNLVFDANRDLDRDLLNQNTRALNQLVVDTYAADETKFRTDYPFTYERITENPLITPAEVQNFIENNFLQPSTFITFIRADSSNTTATLYLLNQYYSPTSFSQSSMGSFCALVPNIFAKFAQFQDIFNSIASFASKFQNLLNSLTSFSLAGLIEGLKSRIIGLVDKLVEKIKKKISTFSAGFVDMARNANAIFTKIAKTKDKVMAFLSDLSVANIKSKIEGMINYAGSLFEKLDIEEIQFLILRFCSFISNLENFFNGLTKPLEQLVSNYQSAKLIFTGGDLATSAAIAAGATRLASHQVDAYINFMLGLDPSIPVDPSIPERGYPPSSGSAISGSGDAVTAARARSGKIQDITRQEIDELPTWEQIQNGHPLFAYVSGMPIEQGWGRAQVLEKVMLMRLAKRWGKITINSAYRSPEYNASVGGAKASQHMSGQAFDCGGVVQNAEFVTLAKEIGFTGFGFYPSFTHIDTGPPRTW